MSWQNYEDVLAQLRSAGLEVEEPLVIGGTKSHRVREINGDREKRGWYWLHELPLDDGLYLVGSFGVYRGDDAGTQKIALSKKCQDCGHIMGMKERTCPSCNSKNIKRRELSPEQQDAIKQRQAENKRRLEAERKAEANRAAQWAHAVWTHSREAAPREHDYLPRKQLNATGGVRIFESNEGLTLTGADKDDYKYLSTFHGALVVPMEEIDTGAKRGLQFILSREHHQERITKTDRDKEYWPAGMQKDGIAFMVGGSMSDVGLVCEGYATGISLHEATGLPVAIAFDANSLIKVGQALRKKYRNRVELIYCADDDWLQKCKECKQYTPVAEATCKHCGQAHGKINAGVQRASEAALATSGKYIVPQFSTARPDDKKGPTDFNDLHCLEGLNAVRAQIETILPQRTGQHAPAARGVHQGGRGKDESRPDAVSQLSLDATVERYIHIDDATGDYVFDAWTKQICKFSKVIKTLPARVRVDDIKDHPTWQGRAVYIDQVGFDPTEKDTSVKCNMWGGWPTMPQKGSCERLLELLQYLCGAEENSQSLYEWVLKWLAYPIQHPGAKMVSALVLHGNQGTGKNLFFESVMRIYGMYGSIVDQKAIEDKFNDWASKKLFLIADEVVARQELYHNKNNIKFLITGPVIRINPKNLAAHDEANHINIVFLSNEVQPLHLETGDRRFTVIWTPPKLDESFYDEVVEELRNGGIEALHHHLLNIDLTGFNEHTKPLMTKAKADLIELGLESPEKFINEWRNGDLELPFGPCLSQDIYKAYTSWCQRTGEHYVKKRQMFIATLRKQTGWEAGVDRDYLVNISDPSTRTKRKMVLPPRHEIATAPANHANGHQIPARLISPPLDGQQGIWQSEWCNVMTRAIEEVK